MFLFVQSYGTCPLMCTDVFNTGSRRKQSGVPKELYLATYLSLWHFIPISNMSLSTSHADKTSAGDALDNSIFKKKEI